MALVFSYIRFSSKPQEQGSSLSRQSRIGKDWLSRHPDHTLDTSLRMRDLGVSAFKGANLDPEQGDLGKFIWLAQHNKKRVPEGSILMLEHLDRFSRDEAWKALHVLTGLLKAGIRILTLEPERMINQTNAGKMEVLFPIVMDLIIAHEHSQRKGFLVGKAWAAKRENIASKKLTRVCPAWLRLSDDKTHFEPIHEKVAIVKRLIQMALSGIGTTQIESRFNREGVAPLATTKRSRRWHKSYIEKILNNPALYGEYQPHKGHAGDRKPVGSPIPDYFWPVISKEEFHRIRGALVGQRLATGPATRRIANLFTSLVFDARDGSNMVVINKGKRGQVYLVSGAAHRAERGSVYTS